MASDTNNSKTYPEKYMHHQCTSQANESCEPCHGFAWNKNRTVATLSERELFWTNIAYRLDVPADGQLVILFDAENCK